MKRYCSFLCLLVCAALILTSCKKAEEPQSEPGDAITTELAYAGQDVPEAETVTVADPAVQAETTSGSFTLKDPAGKKLSPEGNVYTIKTAGEYTASGLLDNGQIIVDAGAEDEVTLILKGASVTCAQGAPILFLNADEGHVNAAEGSFNTVIDARTAAAAEDENNYDAAIYAKCDLKLTGHGTLIVTGASANGVKSKHDLEVRNQTLKVSAAENALKGNDSVEILSGNLLLISSGADGIKTSDSDVSSKGKQRGTVSISGGSVDIYAAADGIDAAYNVEISDAETCNVNIFTASYSEYAAASVAGPDLYLVVSTAMYDEDADYYAYFYNDEGGEWREFTYETMVYNGYSEAYYGLVTKALTGYGNIAFYIMDAGVTPDGTNYTACTDGQTANPDMNAFFLTSAAGNALSGDWVQLSAESGGNGEKTAYSSKGIKAANEILLRGGTVNIKCMDDGLHANMSDALENGAYGLGNITVSGGSLTVTAADDGIHADHALTISGGEVNIKKAHEGLEANVVNISGGRTFISGEDDGVNATRGSETPLINVTGGYLDITTPAGDTDGIDSNGNITMSGGFVLVKGGANMGGMAGSVDADGEITVTGGAIVALGGICETPAEGSVCTFASADTSFSAGDYQIADGNGNEIITFSLPKAYTSIWVSADALRTGQSYRILQNGESVLSWEQSSSSVGDTNGFGFRGGPGGMGGPGSPGGPGGPGGMGHG